MRWTSILAALLLSALAAAPLAADDAEDDKTLKQAGLEADGRTLLRYLPARILTPQDQTQIEQLVRQLGDESFAVRERATNALAGRGVAAVNLLRRATNDPDVEIARRAERCLREIEKAPSPSVASAAIRQIGKLKPAGAAEVLLAFLPNADDSMTADEIRSALAKVAMRDGVPDPAAHKALDSPLPLIRAAAGEALLRAGYRDARRLMADNHPVVRMRVTLSAVTHEHDKTAVPALIDLLAELPASEAWVAEDVLNKLAGDAAPPVALGIDAETRQRCRDAWHAWWQGAADRIDLTKLDSVPLLKGLTLVVQVDAKPASGRVFEVNGAGEIVWKIENLQLPVDAVMVGNDKVLVAEYTLLRIQLREISGGTIWTLKCSMPQSLQALPDGHFLVATRNHILEYDAQQKEVFNLGRTKQDVVAATKDRNGFYLLLTQTGDLIRFDGQKNEVKRFSIESQGSFGALHALPNGNVVVAHARGLSEFDAEGRRQSWAVNKSGQFSSVQRLPNGNTLAASLAEGRVIEYNREGKEVADVRPIDGGSPRRAHRR